MKVTVDRVEKGYAVVVLEDDTLAHMPFVLLPEGAKEGSVIEIVCNDESKQEKENRILSKMDKLFGK